MAVIIIITIIIVIVSIITIIISEMVERGGYTSLDLLDGDCVLRPQVLLYLRNGPSIIYTKSLRYINILEMVQIQSTIYKSVVSHESPLSTGFPRCPILATTKLTGTSGALHCTVKTDHALQYVSFYCRRVVLSSVLHVCVSCLSGLQCHHPPCLPPPQSMQTVPNWLHQITTHAIPKCADPPICLQENVLVNCCPTRVPQKLLWKIAHVLSIGKEH